VCSLLPPLMLMLMLMLRHSRASSSPQYLFIRKAVVKVMVVVAV
jgi:hypothetical protein